MRNVSEIEWCDLVKDWMKGKEKEETENGSLITWEADESLIELEKL